MKKQAIVIHSGGMDSSICLALAQKEFGKQSILSLSFSYGQRHAPELIAAEKICHNWGIDHQVIDVPTLPMITHNAILDHSLPIEHQPKQPPNTFVIGRNGLMARLGAIYAEKLGTHILYMGVMELDSANSGYPDCSRQYIDLKQQILRLDLLNPLFEIRTPLIRMTKFETMVLADELGVLDYLLDTTITCYEGFDKQGCTKCPSCLLRNAGIKQYQDFINKQEQIK